MALSHFLFYMGVLVWLLVWSRMVEIQTVTPLRAGPVSTFNIMVEAQPHH